MSRYYERSHANVHRSIHTLGEEATELYELARDAVQRLIGAPSREEVVFTRGTTDGLGLITGQTSIDDVLNAMDAAWKQGPS